MADDPLKETKRLMGALVRQPPKPHEKMKIGKRPKKRAKQKDKTKPSR